MKSILTCFLCLEVCRCILITWEVHGEGERVGGVDFTRQKKDVLREEQMRDYLACRAKEV